MKKFIMGLMALALVFSLAACGQSESASKNEDNDKKQEQQEAPKKEEPKLTAQDVYDKTMEASEEIKSFAIKMDMEQEMSSGVESLKFDTAIDMDMTMDPLALYQKMTMTAAGEEIVSETYFTEAGMYIYEPTTGIWVKYPDELVDPILEQSGEGNTPMSELQQLEDFADEITLKEEDKYYVLTLKADSSGKFNDLIQQTLKDTMPEELMEMPDVYDAFMNNFKINSMEYEIVIDKETYYPVELNMEMDMDVTSEGETVKMVQSVKAEYSDYNKVDEIVIPQEALESAMDLAELEALAEQ